MNRKKLFSMAVASLLAKDVIADVNPEKMASALMRVESEAYKADYPDIDFQDHFDITDLNDRTATTFGYYYVTKAGKAQLAKPDGSIAWVDSFIGFKQADLYDGNTGYKYKIKDLERVGKLGGNLDSLKAETAISSTLELAQYICYFGDTERGITGFFSNPDIASVGTIGGTDWSSKTSEEKLADLNHLFTTAYKNTKQKEFKPKNKTIRLMLHTDKWSDIATAKLSATSDMTVLEFFVKKCPYLTSEDQVISSPHIAVDKIRIYHKDKKKLSFYWGHQIDFKTPQADDLSFKVPADFSIGGMVLRKPLSCWDMDGI